MTTRNNTLHRGLSAAGVRADAASPAALINEIKTTFASFREANDQRLSAVENRKPDVLLEEKTNRIEASMQDLQSRLEGLALGAAFRGNSEGGTDLVKAAADFSRVAGATVDVDAYGAYGSALNGYVRMGAEKIGGDARAQMSVGSDPNGGYLVTTDMSGRIATKLFESTPMRQVANVITIGTDALEGLIDNDEAGTGWVGETQTRTETTTPTLGKWVIPVHEMYAEPKATQKLLDDASVDVEAWLAGKVADKFSRTENAAFTVGDGTLKPRGLFAYTTVATGDATRAWGSFQFIATGTSGGFGTAPAGSDKLVDLVFGLKAGYRANASFMMSRATLAEVRKLKDGDGNYLWQPDFQARAAGTLLGHAIVEGEDCPAIAANSLSIAFGDFNEAYQIVDRLGVNVLRDPLTQKGFVKFYSRKRVGGGATNFEAVKFLKFSA